MDVHVPFAVTVALRLRGVDVLTAQDDGAGPYSDPSLLDRATGAGRVLFSQVDDLLREAKSRQVSGKPFARVICAPTQCNHRPVRGRPRTDRRCLGIGGVGQPCRVPAAQVSRSCRGHPHRCLRRRPSRAAQTPDERRRSPGSPPFPLTSAIRANRKAALRAGGVRAREVLCWCILPSIVRPIG
jgi:hypothetical protein